MAFIQGDMEVYEGYNVILNNNGIIQQEVHSHLHRLPGLPPAFFNFFLMNLIDLKLCRGKFPLTAITLSVFLYLLIWCCFILYKNLKFHCSDWAII